MIPDKMRPPFIESIFLAQGFYIMKRIGLAFCVAWLGVGVVQAQDRVLYLDRQTRKEADVTGTISKESPAGITIKVRDGRNFKDINVPAVDIRQVLYKNNAVSAPDYRKPFGKLDKARLATKATERQTAFAEALAGFQELAAALKEIPSAQTYMEFKSAEVMAAQASEENNDPTRMKVALEALVAFKNKHETSWSIVPALKLLAKLQEDRGEVDAAAKTYEELAAVPGVPKEIKEGADIFVARLFLRGGKHAEAAKKLEALRKTLAADDPQKVFLDVYQAQCQMAEGKADQVPAQLRGTLASSNDPSLRALAHNILGDYYRSKDQPEEAFWHYLKVDTLYSQDKEEHAKALYFLGSLFDKVKNDPIRAAECRDKLKGKDYAGTFYQRKAERETK
jgi:hypothetical protein